ncbi:hypothetical protein GGR19_002922 [Croceicoccus naphthovorans]|nr:hypothetical protein [Croceicoccus naphthovorans]
MADEFLQSMRQERNALWNLVQSRPTEDWALERERISELDICIREHVERSRA